MVLLQERFALNKKSVSLLPCPVRGRPTSPRVRQEAWRFPGIRLYAPAVSEPGAGQGGRKKQVQLPTKANLHDTIWNVGECERENNCMNFMMQRFASEMGIKVMEWPREAGGGADRELSLLADGMGRRGQGYKARKTDFSLWQDLYFSLPGVQHWVLLLKTNKEVIPSALHTRSPSAHTQLGAMGWVAQCWRPAVPTPHILTVPCPSPSLHPPMPRSSCTAAAGHFASVKQVCFTP